MQTVLTHKFEINKSSDLCQVVFFQKNKKKKVQLYNLSAMQHDLLNIVFYQSNKKIVQSKLNIEENDTTLIELELKDVSIMLTKYQSGEYDKLIEDLSDLSDVKVAINALNKNKDLQETTITRFILSITLSRHLSSNKKRIKILMDNKVLARVHNIKSLFSKMYLTIQLSMVSKYSKLLYELLKDYQGINSKLIDINSTYDLMNVTNSNMRSWSRFKAHILKKAINEINEKSDIKVSYKPIKEKTEENPRLHVEKILFQIEPQPESRLQKLGLLDQEEELSIEEQIFLNKKKSIAKQKLDKILQSPYGQKIEDEDKWIEADIKKFEEKYESMINLDTWQSDMAKKSVEFRREYYIQLGHFLDKSMVGYDKTQYRLTDMFDPSTIYTFDPKETYDTILRFVTETNILEVLEEL